MRIYFLVFIFDIGVTFSFQLIISILEGMLKFSCVYFMFIKKILSLSISFLSGSIKSLSELFGWSQNWCPQIYSWIIRCQIEDQHEGQHIDSFNMFVEWIICFGTRKYDLEFFKSICGLTVISVHCSVSLIMELVNKYGM